ncbi:FMN-binding negative transcriptional regulator [Polaromonas sp. UC242_47]|uniref:FMN-binding negative transcriptional regulator n=1 Tax=Polaromonas sp. UC242_47 TaxID=3374626 RepID=UPI0037B13E36
MYISKHHQLNDYEAVMSLMESHPLGAWVCHSRDGLIANHVPFFLDRTRGQHGTLMGHVARANGVWRQLFPDTPSVVMFQGAQSYITPGWYPGKAEHGKVVPTWNYVVAHAHGTARVIEDPDWMLDMLHRLTDTNESRHAMPWRVGDAPSGYIEKLMRGIVGIEISIDRLEGKLKASQDEDLQDRHGTVRGLQSNHSEQPSALAALVLSTLTSEAPQS